MSVSIAGIVMPDSAMARAATRLVRGTEPDLLFNHAVRTFLFGALAGTRRKLHFDAELLYIAALFHQVGLSLAYRTSHNRFEIDSANAACQFLLNYRLAQRDVAQVWDAIALHATPGIAEHKTGSVALLAAGVQTDLLGTHLDELGMAQRAEVLAAYPREPDFKQAILDALGAGLLHRPETTFGTVHADVLERIDPTYRRLNLCGLILGSDWPDDGAMPR